MGAQPLVPFVIGHRGACGHAPENTLPSFEKALDLGVKWVEIDVKLSSDGVAFLMHDSHLGRTTDGEGAVADTPWSVLSKLDAGAWFDPAFRGTRLVRFEDAMGHLDVMGLGLNIEIKGCTGREAETAEVVCKLVREGWPSGMPAPVISSFDVAALGRVQSLLPDAQVAMLFDEVPEHWREVCESVGASAVHVWHEMITLEIVTDMLDAGYALRSFTVNQRTRAGELQEMGFSSVFCDFPERLSGL